MNKKKISKKKLNYGKENQLTESDLDIKNAKIRITTMIDMAVYDKLKSMAGEMGIGYQTLINSALQRYTGEFGNNFLGKIMSEMEEMDKRLAKIEKQKTA